MPYKRVGKSVYNQKTGRKLGTAKSVGMAKRMLKAVYANTPKGK